MPLKTRDIKSRLLDKFEFSPSENRSVDHNWFELKLPGLPVIATKISHGETDIGDNLLGKISKQLRVRKSFLMEMVSCTKSRDDYIKSVKEDPYPPWNIRF